MVALSLLWGVVLAAGLLGAWSSASRIKGSVWVLLLVATTAMALRISPTNSFYGLEYEDAYVYAAASRFAPPPAPRGSPSGLTVCAVGSLSDCQETEAYPGHLPAFPALLRTVQTVVPFWPALPPTVGAVLGTIATLFIWWATCLVTRSVWSAAVAALLFAATPVLVLYGGSASSEAASAVVVAAAVGAAAAARRAESVRSWWKWQTVALCAVILAAYTRRENAILIAVIPFCLFAIGPEHVRTKQRLSALLMWIIGAAVVTPILWSSLVSEVGEYGEVSFGVLRLWDTLPTVIGALFFDDWFGLLAVGACVGAVLVIREFRDGTVVRDVGLLFGLIFTVAVLVTSYASHVRSTYQLMGVVVNGFDFLRYLSNVGVFLCILAGVPASYGSVTRHRRLFAAALAAYFAVSASFAWTLRNDLSRDETETRTAPALAAIDVAAELDQQYPIVTLEPMVVQLFGPPSTQVIAMPFLTTEHVRAAGGQVVYLRQDHYQSDVDRRRYAEAFAALPSEQRVVREGPGWSVLILGSGEGSDNQWPDER